MVPRNSTKTARAIYMVADTRRAPQTGKKSNVSLHELQSNPMWPHLESEMKRNQGREVE